MRGFLLAIAMAAAAVAFVFYLDARATAQGLEQRLARIRNAQKNAPGASSASISPAPAKPAVALRTAEKKEDPIVFRPTQEDLDAEDKFHRERSESIPVIRARQRQLQRKYYYLFDALADLDPQARAALKEILADRELTRQEMGSAGYRVGNTNRDEVRAATKEMEAEVGYDRMLKDTLGDRYEQFRELDGYAGSVGLLDRLFSPDLKRMGEPLDNATKMKLAGIMTRLHYSRGAPGFREMLAEPVNPASGLTPLNERLMTEARAFLTPGQLEVIKIVQNNQTNARLAGGNP
jgi:hypothetical protein